MIPRTLTICIAAALLGVSCAANAQTIPGALPESAHALTQGEWPAYAGTYAASRYSPLMQIDASNAKSLHVAWRWKSPDMSVRAANPTIGPSFANESTPLMVGGVLYTPTSLSQVAAIDAVTGETKWVYDPKIYENGLGMPANLGWLHRGVAYWRNGDDERIVMLTAFAQLIVLDAKTGKPAASFGRDGRIDLVEGLGRPVDRNYYTMTSPPVIVRGVIVVGSSVFDWWAKRPSPPGDVRGFDINSGRLLWTFHTVAQGEEAGTETWENDSWKEMGNANVWAPMSADEELGYVYLPVSTPTNDYFGGQRPGDGLFGESLVCLDVATGKKVWHYQLVHHGLWDYDPPAAPNLIDITVDGKRIKAVAQVTKQAYVYAFDRVTGKPIWPIEEQAVPASSVPGERASKTQPVPSKPAPFDLQGARDEDLIALTPQIHKEAIEIASAYDRGGLFTPPSERGTIQVPGNAGGASWSGAAIDPETSTLYVGTYRLPTVVKIQKPESWQGTYDFIGLPSYPAGPRGLPLLKPPFGSIVAIDMNTGEHRWRIPVGRSIAIPPVLALGIREQLGLPFRNWALLTKTVMIVVQTGYYSAPRFVPGLNLPVRVLHDLDPHLWVYDKASGEMLAEMELPANATGAPMTYLAGGRQFIVFPVGGGTLAEELIAVSL
ncbi:MULTISPECIES: PQQ-binding-like beta-propeller repeat protein [Bradyrhizobium]|jgi:quinoprotein glucose dehydrogenase|uniref:Quinoprotein glucose dehydrogenase n=2 Tax=Bradyrhizobium TaxID=374 RepID=A0ABY0QEC4_9BRAD|nr:MULTISPECIES: PQQ-binding-like beta-propeller repeat protein [Bradyrhizobium]SDK05404.1 quinoprotein glucose dehydrogenase [Bradyrhizobium ottawaense]SEB84332.1 quinoprotein glucose dehydrogenase [Bradyrhizobium lablabi]